MTGLMLIIITACGFISGVALLSRIRYCTFGGASEDIGRLSIIIPARNEEDNLPRLLDSIARQREAPTEVIVVDDHSTDRTAEIAGASKSVVIRSDPLPDGWLGKTWACHQGAMIARGDIFMFLDADTYLVPGGLDAITNTYMTDDGAMSIAPWHYTERLHEQFSAFFNIVMAASMNAFTIFGSMLRPVGLFGPCLIVSRKQYFDAGGHESVKNQILENFFMAERFAKKGIGIRCFSGKGTLGYRMYPHGFRELVAGWGKAFATGAKNTGLVPMTLISLWLAGAVTVVAFLAYQIVQDPGGATLASGLYMAYAVQIWWFLSRLGLFKWYTAILFPAPLAVFLAIFIRAALGGPHRRNVSWKGRNLGAT